jgi:Fe-S-cluster containining protein
MTCTRCGRCCYTYAFELPIDPDIGRFYSYHGYNVVEKDGAMYVRNASPCRHLLESKDGTTKCAIYVHRPAICRDFDCKRVDEDTGSGSDEL